VFEYGGCSHHVQGTRAVTKTLVARQELERIALQEIRSFPGCEYVTDIEIAYQVDRVPRTNRTIHVFTREGADMLRIQYAISTTRKKLRARIVILASSAPANSQSSSSDMTASERIRGLCTLASICRHNTAREQNLWRYDATAGAPRGRQSAEG
jgi:hypothetical protein